MSTKKRRSVRTLGSKWTKTAVLLRSKKLQPYIPETRRWSFPVFSRMLRKYDMVYVKPVHGSFGRGVMRARIKENNRSVRYEYHYEKQRRKYTSLRKLYAAMNRKKLKKAYLVQKGIPLLKWDKRPFDVRVMVQRTATKPWKATGIIGRLAHPQRVVTNYHSQGTPLPIELLLKPYLTRTQRMRYKSILKRLSLHAAKKLQSKFKGLRQIGVDIGIDQTFHPWILEANTSPDPYIFKQLPDQKVFRRVMRYVKANRKKRRR